MTDLAPDEVHCPACGAVIHETAAFCTECGAENDAASTREAPPGEQPPEERPPAEDPDPRQPGGTPPGEPPEDARGADPRGSPPPGEAPPEGSPPPREPPAEGTAPPPEEPPRGSPPPEESAPPRDRGQAGARRGRQPPAGEYAGAADSGWDVASTDQLLAGLKGGLLATLVGMLVTVVLSVGTMLSAMENLLSDNYDGRVGLGVRIGDVAVDGGAGIILSFADTAESTATFVVKFFVWLFYSANFVPVVLQGGTQSREVDLLAGLTPLGASPIIFRIGVVLVLVLFGYYAAGAMSYRSFPEAAVAGASVALGYLLILVPVALVVGFSPPAGAAGVPVAASAISISPSLGMTVVFAGLLSAVSGACGGLLREFRRRA